MLEVPRVTETSEYAPNNRAGYGPRKGGAEFEEMLGHTAVHETGRKGESVSPGISLVDPDLMLPGGGIDIVAYDSLGNIRRIGRFMGRRVDVAI